MVRQCFLTGEYIFYAEERAKRPHNFKKLHISNTPKELCPFCIENSYMTPKQICSTSDNNIRIVPNKYPFISKNESGFLGIHDVVIDTKEHNEKMCRFSYNHMFQLMKTIKMRFEELEKNKEIKYIQVFKNQGIDAGASQSHSHWQITAMSVIPTRYMNMLEVLKKYYEENGKCYFCNLEFDDRIIEENEHFICYAPYDSKFTYEMHIIPKIHTDTIKSFDDDKLFELGKILKNSVMRLASLYEGISYNVCMFNSPTGGDFSKYNHFYLQIIPRIGHMAGFEFSTGCHINSVLPEKAAYVLRNIIKPSEIK